MAEPRSDDRSHARREAAILLGVDIEHLSAADALRVDMVSALRLVIDHEQASILDGGSADLGKLNVAVQSLIALLPGRELPAPESQREDPRVVLWRIIKEGRDRLAEGFEGYDGKVKQIEVLQAELAAKDAELAALKAGSAPPDVPMVVERVPRGGSTAIDPAEADITPPGEIGEFYAGARPGPDDPPQRSTRVIEGNAAAVTPAASPAAPGNWDNTPNGRAWQAWHDAGGGGAHYDRWKNRNGV